MISLLTIQLWPLNFCYLNSRGLGGKTLMNLDVLARQKLEMYHSWQRVKNPGLNIRRNLVIKTRKRFKRMVGFLVVVFIFIHFFFFFLGGVSDKTRQDVNFRGIFEEPSDSSGVTTAEGAL